VQVQSPDRLLSAKHADVLRAIVNGCMKTHLADRWIANRVKNELSNIIRKEGWDYSIISSAVFEDW